MKKRAGRYLPSKKTLKKKFTFFLNFYRRKKRRKKAKKTPFFISSLTYNPQGVKKKEKKKRESRFIFVIFGIYLKIWVQEGEKNIINPGKIYPPPLYLLREILSKKWEVFI